jgi:cyclophilin family peptidyl-prolyl cis-trans isomerase
MKRPALNFLFNALLAVMFTLPVLALAQHETQQEAPLRAVMATSMGEIQLELLPEKAPLTVENFVSYAEEGFYDGTIFHRVIADFMIQGGGFTPELQKKSTREPIQNEANNGLSNRRGTIAMARLPTPHSATAQFFINVETNMRLDYQDRDNWGYAVFGQVVSGMDVVDRIRAVPTHTVRGRRDVPVEPVVIESVTIVRE